MLKKIKERIRKELENEDDTKLVKEGDFLTVFKKIGINKSVIKTINIKPDFEIDELEGAVNYAFIINDFFDAFKTLNKFLLLKKVGVPLEFKKLIFYVKEDTELYINEEKGVITTQNTYSTKELWNKLLELIEDVEEKIEKRILIIRI